MLFPLGGGGRRRDGAFREPVEGGVGVYVTWLRWLCTSILKNIRLSNRSIKTKNIFRSLQGAWWKGLRKLVLVTLTSPPKKRSNAVFCPGLLAYFPSAWSKHLCVVLESSLLEGNGETCDVEVVRVTTRDTPLLQQIFHYLRWHLLCIFWIWRRSMVAMAKWGLFSPHLHYELDFFRRGQNRP